MNTYGYVYQKPTLSFDPFGLIVPIVGPACLVALYIDIKNKYGKRDDHIQHCEFHCRAICECWVFYMDSILLGYIKEILDAMGLGDAEWRDLRNNAVGRSCAQSGEPDCCPPGVKCCGASGAGKCECAKCCKCKEVNGKLEKK